MRLDQFSLEFNLGISLSSSDNTLKDLAPSDVPFRVACSYISIPDIVAGSQAVL
jgi:hypothetical protein